MRTDPRRRAFSRRSGGPAALSPVGAELADVIESLYGADLEYEQHGDVDADPSDRDQVSGIRSVPALARQFGFEFALLSLQQIELLGVLTEHGVAIVAEARLFQPVEAVRAE